MLRTVRCPTVDCFCLTLLCYCERSSLKLCALTEYLLADGNAALVLLVLHDDGAVLDVLVLYQLAVFNCKCNRFCFLVAVRCALLNECVNAVRKTLYRVNGSV